jgi:hypothetical protein
VFPSPFPVEGTQAVPWRYLTDPPCPPEDVRQGWFDQDVSEIGSEGDCRRTEKMLALPIHSSG